MAVNGAETRMLLAVYTGIVIDKCCMIDTLQMNVCIAMDQKTCK